MGNLPQKLKFLIQVGFSFSVSVLCFLCAWFLLDYMLWKCIIVIPMANVFKNGSCHVLELVNFVQVF